VVPYRAGDADPASFGQSLQPSGDVDAVAVDVAAFGDNIAQIGTDSEGDPLLLGDIGIAVEHRSLHLDRAAVRVDDTGKFDQHPVAGGLYDPAMMFLYFRIDKLAAMRFETLVGSFLFSSHQPRIARDIGGKYRCEVTSGFGLRKVARGRVTVANAAVDNSVMGRGYSS
jgi:hypothetical protein